MLTGREAKRGTSMKSPAVSSLVALLHLAQDSEDEAFPCVGCHHQAHFLLVIPCKSVGIPGQLLLRTCKMHFIFSSGAVAAQLWIQGQ